MSWRRKVLVVANVTAMSDEVLAALRARAEAGPGSFTLVVPATSAGGGEDAAAEQLRATLERLAESGLEADGHVGNCDPIVAIAEAWDPHRYDEILVCTLPTGVSKWLQADLPHRAERLTGAPVTHIVASPHVAEPATAAPPDHSPQGVLSPLLVLGWGGRPPAPAAH